MSVSESALKAIEARTEEYERASIVPLGEATRDDIHVLVAEVRRLQKVEREVGWLREVEREYKALQARLEKEREDLNNWHRGGL